MVKREEILKFFKEKVKRPLSFREVAEFMGLSRSETRALKRLLRDMVRSGDIVRTRKGLYGPTEEMNLLSGYFEAHRDGYGFVVLERPGERDIFVPARWTSGAMNNDRVIVRVENWQRREGRIIRVLERATTRLIGRLEIAKNAYYVRPKNRTIPFDIYVSPKDKGKAKRGDNVLVEIIEYPSDKRPPSGKVIKVLERPGDPKEEVESIIEEFNLPRKFPKNVRDDALLLQRAAEEGLVKRKDLRRLTTVTIDGERARDFDDAVSIRLIEHGYRLWVHIADVSHYVAWDSAIDREARKRATSVYFPDRVIPMLPKELSEDLCSLKPDVDRLTLTVEMDFDRDGNRLSAKFYPGLIRSKARMTYTSVKRILVDYDRGERKKYADLIQDFELMNELCNLLRSKRLQRGSLDFDLPEPEVILDIQGRPEAILRAERNLAHMMIEEFMIAANEAVAEHIESLGIPSLYRVHEEPDISKVDEIVRMVRQISRLRKRPLRPSDFANLLGEVRGSPFEEIVSYMVLRSLKQARYSPINVGHFGLASKCYTHFTSPIRRYPDLVVHRILKEALLKKRITDERIKYLESLLPDIAFHSSRMERLAEEAEREVIDAMRAWFMKDRVGEEYIGKVVGITPFGLRIRLRDFYVEGFLHVSYMNDDFYQYDERSISLIGKNRGKRFTIGDELTVRIDRVDMDEREVVLGL